MKAEWEMKLRELERSLEEMRAREKGFQNDAKELESLRELLK
jgi:hypothetical protein